MKKLYVLTILSLTTSLLSLAQPTIQQSDEPVVNLIFGTAIDPAYSGAIPVGATNVTWDYSMLAWVDTGGGHFLDAATTPYATTFAPANLAVRDSIKDEWIYFQTTSTGFYTKGLDSAGTNLVLNPAQMYLPVPFTYGNTAYHRGRFQIDTTYMGFPGRIIRTYDDYFDGDGYGTLKVPGNTFNGTLRVKTRELVTDTALLNFGTGWILAPGFPQSSQVHFFRWYRHLQPDVFLLEIRADSLGNNATRSEYQVVSFISVPEVDKATVIAPYPNPATNAINISFEKASTGTISVYNSLNQIVRTSSFNDINHYTMYVNTMANGHYHFIVTTDDHKIRKGKFAVIH